MGASRDGSVPVRPVRLPLPDSESIQGLLDRRRVGDRQALVLLLARLGLCLKRRATGRLALHARDDADTNGVSMHPDGSAIAYTVGDVSWSVSRLVTFLTPDQRSPRF